MHLTDTLHHFDYWVVVSWLVEWTFAFGFSRFARWKASRQGGEAYAQWALLPAYEAMILFKKAGLVILLVLHYQMENPHIESGAWSPISIAAMRFGTWVYKLTYVTVFYVLWAQSAGIVTLRRSMGVTLMLALVVATINFLEMAGHFNFKVVKYNTEHNTTFSLVPSFSGGVGYSSFTTSVPGVMTEVKGMNSGIAAMSFWVALTASILGVIGIGLTSIKAYPPPRQPALWVALYALFVTLKWIEFFCMWTSVQDAFGFNPLILFGVVEMPFKYYIMLLDSRVTHIRT